MLKSQETGRGVVCGCYLVGYPGQLGLMSRFNPAAVVARPWDFDEPEREAVGLPGVTGLLKAEIKDSRVRPQ